MSEDAEFRSGTVAAVAAQDDEAAFRANYSGSFAGLLAWDDVDRVFNAVRARPEGWWIYDTRTDLPNAPVDAELLAERIDEIEQFLRRYHKADYCGFVYVDDKVSPRFIKVFDPRNASSCSLGSPIPAFTVSLMRPVALPFGEATANSKRGPRDAAGGESGFVQRLLKRLT